MAGAESLQQVAGAAAHPQVDNQVEPADKMELRLGRMPEQQEAEKNNQAGKAGYRTRKMPATQGMMLLQRLRRDTKGQLEQVAEMAAELLVRIVRPGDKQVPVAQEEEPELGPPSGRSCRT